MIAFANVEVREYETLRDAIAKLSRLDHGREEISAPFGQLSIDRAPCHSHLIYVEKGTIVLPDDSDAGLRIVGAETLLIWRSDEVVSYVAYFATLRELRVYDPDERLDALVAAFRQRGSVDPSQ